MNLEEALKKTYRSLAENRIAASVFFLGYFLTQKFRNKECRKATKKESLYEKGHLNEKKKLKELRVATVCDDMTWQNLKQECQAYSLTPNNWTTVFWEKRPDVFFCESAWVGVKEQGGCWHGKIYKNKRILFENRKDLLEILEFCKQNSIPTVFWNKEDPAFLDSEKYDFKDTALNFDYIFTTAKECVHIYRESGHKNVDVLPFGFSPYLFNPLNTYPKENVAVFAGSWYEEETKRCNDLSVMFKKVIGNKIPLIIYDRQTGTVKEGRKFPEEYQPYVKNAVPFEELGRVLKKAKYIINVNTIENSETMFARRVLEFMAMNTFVISNGSIGMKMLFPDSVCFLENDLPKVDLQQTCIKNMEYVFQYRTNEKLLTEAFYKVGLLTEAELPKVAVITKDEIEKVELKKCDYVFFHDGITEVPKFELLLPHFCYLPTDCGIKVSKDNEFTIRENKENENTLFSVTLFRQVLEQPDKKIQKYYLGISAK